MTKLTKELILITGKPGSGKSRLGQVLSKTSADIEHFSLGDKVRKIAIGTIASDYQVTVSEHLESRDSIELLDEPIPTAVVLDQLKLLENIPLVLVDGYPRSLQQIDNIISIANKMKRDITGLIHLDTDDVTSIGRLINRRTRLITEELAKERLEKSGQLLQKVIKQLGARGIRAVSIDGNTSKLSVDLASIAALKQLTNLIN
jgi:adenylate kinase family enzyme